MMSWGHAAPGQGWSIVLLAVSRRGHDPGSVRRQALASVHGRRVGRQRHAWSRAIPECRSEKRARTQQGVSADRTCIVRHREPRPGDGTPVIATFERSPFLP